MKRLYTSYYARSGKNPKSISISAKSPFFYKGRAYLNLAPSWELLGDYKDGIIDAYGYTERYGQLLKDRGITPEKVVGDLEDGSIMLCYEGPGKFCHRHIVAVWLNQSGKAEVYELEKDGSPKQTPTNVDDLITILDVDVNSKSRDDYEQE